MDNRERPVPASLLDRLVTLLTAMVIFWRLLTPTEGAVAGETLWIAQLTLFAMIVWAFAAAREGNISIRLTWIDAAVGAIGLGEFLSAALNWSQADRRALLNMTWEWCGLVATWFLIRRLVAR